MSGSGQTKVHIAGVSLKLGGNQVLRDISIDVPVGSKSVIIGPAASGKTVLMKCVAGILRPDSGTIEIDGVRVNGPNTSERKLTMQSVGVLFQQGGLFDSVNVGENIGFKLTHTFGVSAADAKRVAVEKLAMVDLPATTADLNPSELSGGMQKRVGIARALAGDPSLLLLDEPTAGLDPITTAAINRQIDRSAREIGATILAITSDMSSARNDYDHLVMLNEGTVVWSGLTSDIESSGNPYVLQLIHGHAEGPIKMRLKARI